MVRFTVSGRAESFSALTRLRRVTLGLLAAMAAMILGAGYVHMMVDHADSVDQTLRRARALSDAGAFHTARNIGEAFRLLEGVADLYSREAQLGTFDEQRFHELIAAKVDGMPLLMNIIILGPDGHRVVSSRVYPVDRSVDVYTIMPVLPRQEAGDRFVYAMFSPAGEQYLPIGVKARDAQNNVIGDVLAMVRPGYFVEFLKTSVDVGPAGAISLWTTEGQLVASSVSETGDIGSFSAEVKATAAQMSENTEHEATIQKERMHDVDQVIARKLVDPLPLVIFVRLSGADYLAPWRGTRQRFFVAGAFVLCATLVFSAIILRQFVHTRRNEEDLRRAKFVAEEANAAKSRFLAHMSHEFRTPLNAIMGFSDVIKGKIMGNEIAPIYTSYADHIHSSGEHLLHIVNDVLDMAKIESGAQPVQREAVDLVEVISGSVAFFDELARQSDVKIARDVPSVLPKISSDARFVRQVLINLLSNAIKFSPHGATVLVRAAVESGGLKVSVTDGGPGIEPVILRRIGEPFLQGEPMLTRAGRGTGLGLSICKHYMDLLGGTLEIDSVIGFGTTATIRFPRALLADAA